MPGSTGHSNVSRPEGAGTGSWDPSAADGSERGASSSSSSRAGPLPPADDPQLSNYLTYLLKGQHPHKFMYFPGKPRGQHIMRGMHCSTPQTPEVDEGIIMLEALTVCCVTVSMSARQHPLKHS